MNTRMARTLLISLMAVSLPSHAIKAPGSGQSDAGNARGDSRDNSYGERGGRGSAGQNYGSRGGERGSANPSARGAGGKRAATLGAVVNVHSGLNKVYHEYCDRTPGIVTNVLAKTDGYCAPETLQPKSNEEIFEALEDTSIAPVAPPEGQAEAEAR